MAFYRKAISNRFLLPVISLLLVLPLQTEAQDRGVIYIGNSSTDLATDIVYSYPQRNIAQSIPIFAEVLSAADPSQTVAKTDDITVSCSNLDDSQGYTEITFNDLTLLGANDIGSVVLTPTETGRTISIQCSAVSTSATCPISSGAQFCSDTSSSNIVSLRLLPPATVTQCELQLEFIATSSTFAIRLSEAANSDVTITCTPAAGSALSLSINQLTLSTGSTEGQVSFSVTNGAADSSATVTCSAQSAQGSQYTQATSQVDASTAVFTLRANSLSFQPSSMQVINTTITSFLVLEDRLASQSVSVACRASTYSSLVDALAAPAPVCSDIDDESSGQTTPWRVLQSEAPYPVFELTNQPGANADEASFYHQINIGRVQTVTRETMEVVVAQCCVRDSAPTTLQGLTATLVAVADLSPFICDLCNTTVTDPKIERVIQNPGYVEVAPCPCDLTQNACDFDCCCDEVCSTNQQARFNSCLPYLPGGQPAEPEEYRCSSEAFNLPDWHRLTCVWEESNAYQGQFYMNPDKVASDAELESLVEAKYKGSYSFGDPETQRVTTSYNHGETVTTLREDSAATNPARRGTLALPRPGTDGSCDPLSQVKYLVDQQASCTNGLTVDTCSDLSGFSARIYAISSEIAGCSQSFKVTSSLDGDIVAPADVRYYCATDISPYLPSATAVALSALPDTQGSTFNNDLINENCSTPCSNQQCINYNIGREYESSIALPPACTWDDGATSPPVPSMNGDTCENVVLEVRYKFEWAGSQITSLSAEVIVGDVPSVAAGDEILLTQEFEAEWIHQSNGSVYTLSDNYSGTTEAYERSGSAGYDPGSTLWSGCAVYDSSTGDFEQVLQAQEREMAVWRPGTDGLCENAARQSLTFGDDTFSSCALRLTADDLETGCDDLRTNVFNHLNVLMPADVLGRYGYNNPLDLTMWIPVNRQTLNEIEDTAFNVNDTARTWADAITGQCRLPTGINLNVIYTQTGEVNGYPRLEVIGAYISYTESTWSMDCQGALVSRCETGSTLVQNFFLSSSVQFTRVETPADDGDNLFYTRCDPYDFTGSDSCERFFSHVYREECYWETCWQELFFPVVPAADRGPDYDWRLKGLPVFLAMVLGIVGYVSVARPGWS